MQLDTREKNISCYKKVIIEKIGKKKNKLSRKKASQSSDTTKRMDKENADISADFLSESINVSFKLLMFPNSLKLTVLHPYTEKAEKI